LTFCTLVLGACGRDEARDVGIEPFDEPAVPVSCAHVAAPGGDDDGPGTQGEPYATFEALANSLAPGETGCLSGAGESFVSPEFVIDDPEITIASTPGTRALMQGRVYVAGAATGSRLLGVDIDLAGQTSEDVGVQINAEGFELSDSTITDDQNQICVSVGADDQAFGSGDGTVIADNTIQGCGEAGSNFAQGLYVNGANLLVIDDNSISGASARGIQLVGDADQNTIQGNLIFENGQGIGFGGRDGAVPDGNLIEGNVLANPADGFNVTFAFEATDPQPIGNVLRGNCLWAGEESADGGVEPLSDREVPLEVSENVVAEPVVVGGSGDGICALGT
jgi:parallel beta-helix repeat protein